MGRWGPEKQIPLKEKKIFLETKEIYFILIFFYVRKYIFIFSLI